MSIDSILANKQPRKGNFVENVQRSNEPVVYCITIDTNEKRAWYIFEPEPLKTKKFMNIVSGTDAFNFADFGIVHYSGWGNQPPEEIKQHCREKYKLFLEE